ncbi:MAG: cupin domain-containing protein [Phycisphaerales bacterium]|nr:MAG: cupin domain-containing protein [Phycisphaerales bacterium]
MSESSYPEFIKGLPEADIPFDGVRGWLSQGESQQVVFFEIDPIGEVSTHTHGDQWGIVVKGEMELTIGEKTRKYGPGDSYYIPAGKPHSAKFLSFVRVIDVFGDVDRYGRK